MLLGARKNERVMHVGEVVLVMLPAPAFRGPTFRALSALVKS